MNPWQALALPWQVTQRDMRRMVFLLLGVAVTVISLGGVMASDPGLLDVRHLYHLVGSRDRVQRLGLVFFAGRWPLLRYSPWNQARARGLITVVAMGPMKHTGDQGYLSTTATLPDGRTFLAATLDAICGIIDPRPLDGRLAS